MAENRITVHLLDPEDRKVALATLKSPEETDAFITGFVDDDGIRALEEKGLMIEREERKKETVNSLKNTLNKVRDKQIEAAITATPISEEIHSASDDRFLAGEVTLPYTFEIEGPLLPSYIEALHNKGVELDQSLDIGEYSARVSAESIEALLDLPFVYGIRPQLGKADTLNDVIVAIGPSNSGKEFLGFRNNRVLLDIRRDLSFADDTPVRDAIRLLNGQIEEQSRRKLRVSFPRDIMLDTVVAALGSLPEIDMVEPYVPPELHLDYARSLVGIPHTLEGRSPLFPLDGTGEIIAIADTGIDETHEDFSGRLATVVALGRQDDASDPVGHGTHVAGVASGNGSASEGEVAGIAAGAKIYFQSIYSRTVGGVDQLEGLPLDLEDLFQPAFDAGARIHNNSWGNRKFLARYNIAADEVDEFVHRNPEMLVIFSAGNEGTAHEPVHVPSGFVDLLSVTTPATAKNALTVGAQRSDRMTKGQADVTFRMFNGARYPEAPIGDQTMGGDPEALAAFSSRGPTGDERIKPEIVAPGTSILSSRSKDAGDHRFWANEDAYDGKYGYMGGTSMAAPMVAGAAAIVRQFFREEMDFDAPSAALVKATLINGSRFLTGADSISSNGREPNYDQGFGALDLRQTLPNRDFPSFALQAIDAVDSESNAFRQTGELKRYRIEVKESEPLRVCLAWSDPPGRGVQNDIDLMLLRAGSSERWIGNEHRRQLRKDFDRDNNVEVVRIDTPKPGFYEIRISSWTIIKPPQPFAMVVTGAIANTILALS
ncbi:S8 family serine peptidase [Parasphingorhabdus sp.]|uniref:S8 family serine peptidase n=1 Tax=Parasphingorhabdus sp. TaxID=2709688 RepID=UPI00359368BB